MDKIIKVKIGTIVLLTDGTFKLIKDKKMGDYFLKQTPKATSLLVYSILGLNQAVPLTDNKNFIFGCREFLQDNQGLVEVVNTKTKNGNICAYSIIKEKIQPLGMMYILTMQIAYEDFIVNIHGEFKEEGMTGERDAAIFMLFENAKNNKKYKLDFGNEKEWLRDPYDKKYKKGALMNLSELPQFDEVLPNHPLSEARKVVNIILQNN